MTDLSGDEMLRRIVRTLKANSNRFAALDAQAVTDRARAKKKTAKRVASKIASAKGKAVGAGRLNAKVPGFKKKAAKRIPVG